MNPRLSPFTVIYLTKPQYELFHFNCWAEDMDDAAYRCEEAYYDVDVIWINTGHDNLAMYHESSEEFYAPI